MKTRRSLLVELNGQHPVGHNKRLSGSPILLVCEHASNLVPESLANLGLPKDVLLDHIGWDIGAFEVAKGLSERFQAEFIFQQYSRLVIDCNRPLKSKSLIPEISENTAIPGNNGISDEERVSRIREIWQPFNDRIERSLEYRRQHSIPTILVAVHSFNPTMNGISRPWEIGLLFNRDDTLANLLEASLNIVVPGMVIGMNEPYEVSDEEDHTIPSFGEAPGIPHVLLEIRNDLIDNPEKQGHWTGIIESAFLAALEALEF